MSYKRQMDCYYAQGGLLGELRRKEREESSFAARTHPERQSALPSVNCPHAHPIDVGRSREGMGDIIVEWCPDCGALKRTMTNWKYTKHPWQKPRMAKRAKGATPS